MKSLKALNSVLPMAIAVALAPCAFAQDQDDTNTQSSDESSNEVIEWIVVTGSRIEGAPAASPVVTVTREDIEARGRSSVEDVLRYVPQNFSSINSGGRVDGRSPRFDDGAVSVNLRGLGDGATLVLVDGKRIASSPAETGGTFTDVSTIPFAAIERVEILTDGASAIYGSDAVAGVVNFIMKKEYSGLQSHVRFENSSNGGDRAAIDLTGGHSWSSGNVTASLSVEKQDPTTAPEAGLATDGDFSAQGGQVVQSSATQQGSPTTRIASGSYDLTPDSDQISLAVNFRQALTSNLDLSISGTYSDRESSSRGLYNNFRAVVPDSNYYRMTAVPPIDPADTVRPWYAFFNETDSGALSRPLTVAESTRYGLTASLDWQLPFRDWELSVGLGVSETDVDRTNTQIQQNSQELTDALASSDPATALNLLGDGSMQHPNLNSLRTDVIDGTRTSDQDYVSLGWRGTMLSMPAGDLKFSVGAELRNDSTDFTEFRLNPIGGSTPELANFAPEIENKSFFAEVLVPLLSERSLAQELSLSIAARYDEYEFTGPFDGATDPFTSRTFDDVVPKVGLVWYPTDALKLRATWGEAFQVPTLVELFRPPTLRTWFFPVLDPFDPVDPTAPRIVGTIFGGNSSLTPQTSETKTIGFDYASRSIEGLSVSMTWNETEFTNLIGVLADVYPFVDATPALLDGAFFPDAVVRDTDGTLLGYSPFLPINLSSRTVEALDFSVQYAFDTSRGNFEIGVQGTRQLSMDVVAGPGATPFSVDGTENAPADLNVNVFADWRSQHWTVNLGVNHQDGYTISFDDQVVRPEVGGYTTVDTRVGYRTSTDWRLSLGVNNLFDRDFPFADNRVGVDSSRVDFRGRVVYFDVTNEFSF